MSQALVNEVRSLRARVVALEEHLRALEANIEAHYQRKRGPKPAPRLDEPQDGYKPRLAEV